MRVHRLNYERADLPKKIETSYDLSKLPVGPLNTEHLGFVPLGYTKEGRRKDKADYTDEENALVRAGEEWIAETRAKMTAAELAALDAEIAAEREENAWFYEYEPDPPEPESAPEPEDG